MTRAVPPTAGARLLADLAALGPYFAVDVHRPGSPLLPPWQPLGELVSSPDALAARIGEARERLAAAAGRCPSIPRRPAGSPLSAARSGCPCQTRR